MATKLAKSAASGHTAGIFADMSLDGPEIGTLVAVIDRAKNLPNRKTMGKQDPYCAMRLGKEAKKTNTDRRGGQTPKWDQELRFTVHDSPDYYKLKCSVFNDDKRTDLIGESWIDLSDLVKPGGGSNDLWHQLNYKGKYAGDVRIELTYYDLRPRDIKPVEKKKVRDSPPQTASEGSPSNMPVRRLGPREVRRRPLPTSPDETIITAERTDIHPVPPPKIPLDQEESSSSSKQVQPYLNHSLPRHKAATESVTPRVQHYQPPFCEDSSPRVEYDSQPTWLPLIGQHEISGRHGPATATIECTQPRHSLPDLDHSDLEQSEEYPHPEHFAEIDHEQLYEQTGTVVPVHHPDAFFHANRSNTSPVRPVPHRHSISRHSINLQNHQLEISEEPGSYDEPLPPPPPKHRETPPRSQQMHYPPSSFNHTEQALMPLVPRALNPSPRRSSVDEQSPLQRLEREYTIPYAVQDVDSAFYNQRGLYEGRVRGPEVFETPSYPDRLSQNFSHNWPNQSGYSSFEPVTQHHNQSQAQSYFDNVSTNVADESKARSHDALEHRNSSHNQRHGFRHQNLIQGNSQTKLSRSEWSRPSSSSSTQLLQRKPVSPNLPPQPDERRLSAEPYGPDAYDVLNPGSSPHPHDVNHPHAYDQSRYAAHDSKHEIQHESGPIIGNDGRVIDPSDHLPSDTWAPEPERKTRRPEHVIHVRTKQESRLNHSSKSAPAFTSPNNHRSPPPKQRQDAVDMQHSALSQAKKWTTHSPNSHMPFQHDKLSRPSRFEKWNAPESTRSQHSERPLKRHSYVEPTSSNGRPQLSEYQVPAANSYTPRGQSFTEVQHPTRPAPHMQAGRDHHISRRSVAYDDPLAAEMSLIDIGPSQANQLVHNRWRVY